MAVPQALKQAVNLSCFRVKKQMLFIDFYDFFPIRPPLGLLPVLGPLERYCEPTLDAALLSSSRVGADLGRMSVINI